MSFVTLLGIISQTVQLVGFGVNHLFWLRTLLAIGFALEALALILPGGDEHWSEIIWALLFFMVNGIQAVLTWRKLYVTEWSEEERYLQTTAFRNLPHNVFKQLMDIAEWKNVAKGEVIVEENQEVDRLMLIYDGAATVHLNDKIITYLRENSFVGEMSFLTGNPASATVRAALPTRCITWRKNELYDLMSKETELKTGLQTLFSHDLAEKLSKQNTNSAQPKTAEKTQDKS